MTFTGKEEPTSDVWGADVQVPALIELGLNYEQISGVLQIEAEKTRRYKFSQLLLDFDRARRALKVRILELNGSINRHTGRPYSREQIGAIVGYEGSWVYRLLRRMQKDLKGE